MIIKASIKLLYDKNAKVAGCIVTALMDKPIVPLEKRLIESRMMEHSYKKLGALSAYSLLENDLASVVIIGDINALDGDVLDVTI